MDVLLFTNSNVGKTSTDKEQEKVVVSILVGLMFSFECYLSTDMDKSENKFEEVMEL